MSIPWGPALDAELAYRHEQARHDFRPWSWLRKPAKNRGETLVRHQPTQHVMAEQVTAQHTPSQQVTAQHIPAQRGPVPLIPARPRPVDRLAVPQQSTQARTGVDQAQSSAHAA